MDHTNEYLAVREICRREDASRNEAREEGVVLWVVGDDLGAHSCLHGGLRAGVLHRAIDAEQIGPLAADAQYEVLAANVDTIVVVGDPPIEGRYDGIAAGEEGDGVAECSQAVVHMGLQDAESLFVMLLRFCVAVNHGWWVT
jgi:hypothetical protein